MRAAQQKARAKKNLRSGGRRPAIGARILVAFDARFSHAIAADRHGALDHLLLARRHKAEPVVDVHAHELELAVFGARALAPHTRAAYGSLLVQSFGCHFQRSGFLSINVSLSRRITTQARARARATPEHNSIVATTARERSNSTNPLLNHNHTLSTLKYYPQASRHFISACVQAIDHAVSNKIHSTQIETETTTKIQNPKHKKKRQQPT
jgi:hypothetical protein